MVTIIHLMMIMMMEMMISQVVHQEAMITIAVMIRLNQKATILKMALDLLMALRATTNSSRTLLLILLLTYQLVILKANKRGSKVDISDCFYSEEIENDESNSIS